MDVLAEMSPKVKDPYKPTPYDISRNPSLAKGRDVVMDVLAEMSGESKPPITERGASQS
jgi:hypothetical protein